MASMTDTIVKHMFDKIADKSDVFFKSQQKDETDLTFDDKRVIVEKVFNDNKEAFLQRYGKYLSEEELTYFDELSDNSIIDCLLKDLRKCLIQRTTTLKNRRFEALHRLIKSGQYFSDFQMQTRSPLLFDEMIGQHMTEEEKSQLVTEKHLQNGNSNTFSSFLLQQLNKRETQTTDDFKDDDEEFDSEDSDSDIDLNNEELQELETKPELDDNEKLKLRQEFVKIMSERFLSGKDSEFYDYNECDNDSNLDINDMADRDEEDRYFDAEDT